MENLYKSSGDETTRKGRLGDDRRRSESHPALVLGASADEETWLGLLIMAVFWALLSGAIVAVYAHEQNQRSAWRWVASFAASSLAAAYCFGRLM